MVIEFETGIKHDIKVFHFDAVVNSLITEVKRYKFLILMVIRTSTIDDHDFSLFDVHFKVINHKLSLDKNKNPIYLCIESERVFTSHHNDSVIGIRHNSNVRDRPLPIHPETYQMPGSIKEDPGPSPAGNPAVLTFLGP